MCHLSMHARLGLKHPTWQPTEHIHICIMPYQTWKKFIAEKRLQRVLAGPKQPPFPPPPRMHQSSSAGKVPKPPPDPPTAGQIAAANELRMFSLWPQAKGESTSLLEESQAKGEAAQIAAASTLQPHERKFVIRAKGGNTMSLEESRAKGEGAQIAAASTSPPRKRKYVNRESLELGSRPQTQGEAQHHWRGPQTKGTSMSSLEGLCPCQWRSQLQVTGNDTTTGTASHVRMQRH